MPLLREVLNTMSFRKFYSIFIKVIFPSILFYSISLLILRLNGYGVIYIIRDTAQITKRSSFLGFLSNIGVWLWVCSVAICFFVLFSKKSLNKNHKYLILFSGLLSLVLAIDDFFMIHDRYVNQYICYLTYAILALTLLFKHYKLILIIEPMAFLLMGFFLMASIGIDVIQSNIPLQYKYTQIFEEGFKFIGASTWLYFNFKVGDYSINSEDDNF